MAQSFKTWLSNKWQMIEALVTSTGAADAGKIVATNVDGILDDTVVNTTTTGGAPNAGKRVQLNGSGVLDISMLPSGVGDETEVFPASEALSAGDAVNKWNDAGTVKVRKADTNGKPADGYVKAAVVSGANATVYSDGLNDAVTGLTIGTVYLSATPWGYSSTPPADASGLVLQELGFANSATAVKFVRGIPVTLAS